jgi:uncharacterized protein YjbI with pentapeptide repeats
MLAYTDLTGANLREANLQGAYLYGAGLHGADLRGADLRGAKLTERSLGCKYLPGAEIGGACYDRNTRWPDGIDPSRHGALRKD